MFLSLLLGLHPWDFGLNVQLPFRARFGWNFHGFYPTSLVRPQLWSERQPVPLLGRHQSQRALLGGLFGLLGFLEGYIRGVYWGLLGSLFGLLGGYIGGSLGLFKGYIRGDN